MFTSKASRVVGFAGTVALSGALVAAATGATGAYFSDSRSGHITGTIGSIKVSTSGGAGPDNLNFTWADMLPGELKSSTFRYENTGRNAQDVYLVFTDAAQLHALNDLGHYGEAHIASNGTEIFASTNLNDHDTCPATDANGPTDCAPIPAQIKLAGAVQPGETGSATFSFGFSELLKGASAEEAPFGPLDYSVVATQVGVSPTDVNNTPNNLGPGH
jgi:hypothetical protein